MQTQLVDVTKRAGPEAFPNDVGGGFHAHEHHSCAGYPVANLPGGFHAVHFREANVEQDQVRLEVTGELDGFHAIGSLSDNPELRPLCELEKNGSSDSFVVFDDQYRGKMHVVQYSLLQPCVN